MKERLDVLLVQKGFFPTREKAKTSVMAGLVFVNGQLSDKAGMSVPADAEITVKGNNCPYVGRGGLKLQKALETFGVDVTQAVCADIGASTGGFTDCMLQHGAAKVYAIDVGYGQLDYKLRTDQRVINLEKTNIRYFDPETIDGCDFISIDVSFISTHLVFPVAAQMLRKGTEGEPLPAIASLVKPQFEAGREQVGKHGIVADPAVHKEVLQKVIGYAEEAGLGAVNVTFSPITGGKEGNIEYLLFLQPGAATTVTEDRIDSIVAEAHATLKA